MRCHLTARQDMKTSPPIPNQTKDFTMNTSSLLRRPLAAALALAAALTSTHALARDDDAPFSRTVFFGDSLTDAGFFRPLLPAAAQPVIGQFTTNPGLVWSQYLANYYGADRSTAWLATGALPKADDGDNYAVGGARVATDSIGALGYTPSLDSQLSEYLRRNGGRADARALYTVWGGANDLFAITAGAPAASTIADAVSAQIGLVGKLRAAGAEYILVPTIPDLGVTPGFLAQGSAAAAQGTALSVAYNNALYQGLAAQGLRVIPLDTFNLLREITGNPGAYGLQNVTGTACQPQITAQSLTCNPTSYVSADAPWTYAFADGVHPSSAAHAMLADYAVASIEGPRQVALLPRSAIATGRARSQMVAAQLQSRSDEAAGRFWGGMRVDARRAKNETTDDGFGGGGAEFLAGYDRASGALAYGGYLALTRQEIDYRQNRGDFKQREAGLGGYLGWRGESFWVDGQIGWSRLGFDVRRDAALGSGKRRHEGSPDGSRLHAAFGAGWQMGGETFRHGPLLRVLAQRVKVDGYTESQPQLATALAFPEQQLDVVNVAAGWQAEWHLGSTQPFVSLTAEREYGDRPEQAFARMTTLAVGGDYAVPAPLHDRRYANLHAGLRSQLQGVDIQGGVSLDLGHDNGSQAGVYFSAGKKF
ncbi:autotransporter domain-containing esterase [Lysobacteraceae bacterium NML08-0793]|nr:autotransporter domain-containing esterase [Xanthomonadaceae bacterium NML08-0793]